MKTAVLFGFVLGALSAAGKMIITKTGQRVTLECGVSTFTNSLVWHHQDDLIVNVNGKTGFPRKGQGDTAGRAKQKGTNLEISGVKLEDAGMFSCDADGKHQEHTLVVVSVLASPSGELELGSKVTLHCQVKGLTPEFTVQWKRPDGGPHTGSAIVQLQSVARSDAGTWNCMFFHGGETYNQSLDIKVTEPAPTTPAPVPPQNPKNGGVTNPPSNADLLLGLSRWMWVVIGVGGLVVVLLMVFVICMCKRVKRKKRTLQMRNGRQLQTPKQYCQCNRPTAAAKPQQGRRREKPSAPPLQPLLME